MDRIKKKIDYRNGKSVNISKYESSYNESTCIICFEDAEIKLDCNVNLIKFNLIFLLAQILRGMYL